MIINDSAFVRLYLVSHKVRFIFNFFVSKFLTYAHFHSVVVSTGFSVFNVKVIQYEQIHIMSDPDVYYR
jgi:hypothetical protein